QRDEHGAQRLACPHRSSSPSAARADLPPWGAPGSVRGYEPMIDCTAMLVPEPLPEVFRERFAGLEEQCPATRAGDVYAGCFGCGQAHPSGLRVRCFKVEGGVVSPILIDRRYEG